MADDLHLTRRGLLALGGAGLVACVLGGGAGAGPAALRRGLLADSQCLLDLPPGFRYRVLQEEGDRMDGGARVPGDFDGMAAFAGTGGTTVLVRNHELESSVSRPVEGPAAFDDDEPGGTTALVVGPGRNLLGSYATSAGTVNNCAGGATPWGTWLTCEESRADGHGLVFEVQPGDARGRLSHRPIRAMGAFSHEAVAVDPATGIVYLTEDHDDGPSFLYRYRPDERAQRPGVLHEGGRLEVLLADQAPRRAERLRRGRTVGVRWSGVGAEHPHGDAEDRDALRFTRLEGADFAGGTLWFSDTEAGEEGRLYRYVPDENALELVVEGTRANGIVRPDNVTVTPWGDVWFAEDGDGANAIVGLGPDGTVYPFATCQLGTAELTGPTFAPDGRTFFVNVQEPGLTLAVWGPFPAAASAGRIRAGRCAPPVALRPRLTPEQVEAGARAGLSSFEAAALLGAGLPLS